MPSSPASIATSTPPTPTYLGPDASPAVVDAVAEAGACRVDDVAAAEFVVWFGGPEQLRDAPHPNVRAVQLPSAGIERWFAADALWPGVCYASAAGVYRDAVAEQCLALMLAGARRLPEMARSSSWHRPETRTLRGATLGIVGAGGIGRALIELVAPLQMRILAITRSGTPVPGAETTWTPDCLPELLAASDYVVVAAPATKATRQLIGTPELERMRPDAWLVNVARGSLVDTDALLAALRAGRIGGAALDVTDPEPLPDGHPLWTEPRALITCHTANPPSLLLPQLARRAAENLRRLRSGRELLGLIDPVRGY